LQSAHADRRRNGCNNWPQVLELYDALWLISPTPVVAINRALAIAELQGPHALAALPECDARLADYQPYWAVRAKLLAKSGQLEQAADAYQVAIGLELDPAVRRFLLLRLNYVTH
jgi:RNA polymerase sigma-70 factor, ECF subfamily